MNISGLRSSCWSIIHGKKYQYGLVDSAIELITMKREERNTMKAILEFILPEEEHDYKLAIRARDLSLALSDVQQLLRTYRKYKDLDEYTTIALVDEICEGFFEILQERTLVDLLDG